MQPTGPNTGTYKYETISWNNCEQRKPDFIQKAIDR